MAAQRPAVLVFQEFASLSFGAATPELNCLIAGPAYWIKDFADERAKLDAGADIKLATNYGVRNAPATLLSTAPVAGPGAIVVAQPPSNRLGALLDAASVKVWLGKPRVELRPSPSAPLLTPVVADGSVTVGSPVFTSATLSTTTSGVQAGDWCIITDSAGTNTQVRKIRSVDPLTPTQLTFTDDVTAPLTTSANNKFRIERDLPDSLVDASFYTVTGNSIDIEGGITLLVNGVARLVSYGEVFIGYRSLRQDLADVITLSSVNEIVGQLGLIDARNPLAVGMFTALTNSSASIQGFGVQENTLIGYTAMKSSLANRKDIYAVVPLIQDISVIAMLKAEFENLADPGYAVINGVSQKFRMVVGSPTALPVTKIVIDAQVPTILEPTAGDVEQNGVAPVTIGTLSIIAGPVDFITSGVLPGDTLVVTTSTSNDGTYTVAHVNSAISLEVSPPFPLANSDATTTIAIQRGASPPFIAATSVSATTSALDALWLDLFDANGTFIDDGVLPGDFVEMPTNPNQTSFASSVKLQIETIVSNQRVRIKNNGSNEALADNELPHGVTRTAPVFAIPTTSTLAYRIVRTLDKTGQVTELISVAQSLKSRRAVICWPDSVDVSGLTDGSLPRNSLTPGTASPAASQPGYYLSCAVGGMLASLPSHQGITNMGIAGISKIYNANTYFDDKQMTQISNGGWLLFQQDTPSALPYIIHQLTTDPSTLEFGEISLVKNFDFVSLFFSDILDDFLGIWNINPETIQFITSALNAGIENLKLRRRVRIGAPIISGRITSVAESLASSDRVEVYIEIDFPKPLNTIGLHLVSI